MTTTIDTKDAIDRLTKFNTEVKRIYSIATISCPLKKVGEESIRVVRSAQVARDLNDARQALLRTSNSLRKEFLDYPLETRDDLDYMLDIADEFCKVPFVVYES